MNNRTPTVYNIPASLPLADTLAKGLIHRHKDNVSALSETLILLPTRRSCRSLQEAFLRQTEGKPLLLPKMQSFGDIDAEELSLSQINLDQFDLLPAMPPLKRQILLAQIIDKLPNYGKSPAQNMALAHALGQLMDQIYTENLDLADLPSVVDQEDFAAHWQITLNFLTILSEHWPKILDEHGCIDAADRRNRLILMLDEHWQTSPPSTPIISAGSTGSIPATAKLLKIISTLPNGEVILPGLDTHLNGAMWDSVDEGHPQANLKNLLNVIDIDRQDVKKWPGIKDKISNDIKEKIFSHVMTPAEHTDQWTKVHVSENQKTEIIQSLEKLKIYNCDTPQEEAKVIALIMRDTLQTKSKTAALITPDRILAKRVANICQRWNIALDDSGGTPLSSTPIGTYLQLSAKNLIDGIKPLSFLSLLKHDFAAGKEFPNFRKTVREMDKTLLRGLSPPSGFDALKERYKNYSENPKRKNKPSENILDLLNYLENFMGDALQIFSQKQNFKLFLQHHIELIEKLSTSADKTGAEILWSGEAGENASNMLSELYDYADEIGKISPQDYLSILEQVMGGATVRPKYGTHPRLMILGQLEARLIQTDVVILSGLNEGTWPSDPGNDPWMSRPMRQNYGLPLPERSITLAAHDFVQGACSKETFITRSIRQDSAPSVPARWLQRLETFLMAIHINPQIIQGEKYHYYAKALDFTALLAPIERPAPTPPLNARPNALSVTKIDTWLKDPYQIYTSKILQLYPLEELDKNFDAAERGTLLHKIMEIFTTKFPKDLPANASAEFFAIAQNTIQNSGVTDDIWNSWKPKIIRLADWVVTHETQWRASATFLKSEAYGDMVFDQNLSQPFKLSGRVDRIDRLDDNTYAIIDYKSGGDYSLKKIQSAELNQLPLEALILENGGFENSGIYKYDVGSLSYWKMTGGRVQGKITDLRDRSKIEESIELAEAGLTQLITAYDNDTSAYMAIPKLGNAPRFNDYEHLERVKEWAALDEEESTEVSYG